MLPRALALPPGLATALRFRLLRDRVILGLLIVDRARCSVNSCWQHFP